MTIEHQTQTVKTLGSSEDNVRQLAEQEENRFGFQPLIMCGSLDRGLTRDTFRAAEGSTHVVRAPVWVNDDCGGVVCWTSDHESLLQTHRTAEPKLSLVGNVINVC